MLGSSLLSRTWAKISFFWGKLLFFIWEKRVALLSSIIAILTGVFLGLVTVVFPLNLLILAIAGIGCVFITLYRPEYLILLIVGVSSSIFSLGQIPTVSIGFNFSAIEILIIGLLGYVFIIVIRNIKENYVHTPLNIPIILFFLVSLFSLVNSVIYLGTDVDVMEYQWRLLFIYFTFFIVTHLVKTHKQLKTLIIGLLIISTIVALLMVIQQSLGASLIILPGRVETRLVNYNDRFVDISRILPPGQSIIYIMFLPAIVIYLFRSRRNWSNWLYLFAAFLLSLGLAFTFNRSNWVSMAAVITVFFLLITWNHRKKFIKLLYVIFLLGIIIIPIIYFNSPKSAVAIDAIVSRITTLFNLEGTQESASWQWRIRENEKAIAKIIQHPLLGIGPGADYRSPDWSGDVLTGFVHNGYLFILLDLGILGFLAFIWFSAAFLIRGFRKWRLIQNEFSKAVVISLTLSYSACLIVNISAPVFMTSYWITIFGVIFGINEVIYRIEEETNK
jgi:O-antigen ligase